VVAVLVSVAPCPQIAEQAEAKDGDDRHDEEFHVASLLGSGVVTVDDGHHPSAVTRTYTRTWKHAIGFQKLKYGPCMASWSFLTNHARVLLCVAHDPRTRLRDLAAMVGVTERSAHDIVSDLVAAGYVVRDKDSRGNEYRIERHLPLRDPISRERTVGEVLNLLVGVNAQRNGHGPGGMEDG
jgi:IclR helix-turn-helix domain